MALPHDTRGFSFQPTPAVVEARARRKYVSCAACGSDQSTYLFHKVGVRFVRCKACGLAYANPVAQHAVNYFDIARMQQYQTERERQLCVNDFDRCLESIAREFERSAERPARSVLVLGRYLPEFARARSSGPVVQVAPADDDAFREMHRASSIDFARAALERGPDIVVLNELLEACSNPAAVLERIVELVPATTRFAVVYSNSQSSVTMMLRRYWAPFFNLKSVFFTTSTLETMAARFDLTSVAHFPYPSTYTSGYMARQVAPGAMLTRILDATPLASVAVPAPRSGTDVAFFERLPKSRTEKLSIVMPVFNEAGSCEEVIRAVLAKPLSIEKELIIVESNSSDGTRDIVRRFDGQPGVRVVYEDRPRGKGHAVRTGLKAVTGTIILIQDADFEYDLDDYDALLEPILQHRTTFVLGSRSIGLDDWKVRRFARGAGKGMMLNAAQVAFAQTFNVLFQKRTTDINTMFKVFRVECLRSFELECNGFELDIELVCKLVRYGHAPIEVPVNYVGRGFDEGKKIRFWRDAIPSYASIFVYRFR
jgi:Glycosyl transferase family 2